jgi:hypothetical protein
MVKRKTTSNLVNSYGFSIASIRMMETMTPYVHPVRKTVEAWAKFLLEGESREEMRWQTMGIPLLEEYYEQPVVLWKPKAISFLLPGGRYSPDFFYIFEDGLRLHVEVKGSTFQAGYRDSRAKMRVAATLYWFDKFMMVIRNPKASTAWLLEEVEPDPNFQTDLQALAAEIPTINTNDLIEREE